MNSITPVPNYIKFIKFKADYLNQDKYYNIDKTKISMPISPPYIIRDIKLPYPPLFNAPFPSLPLINVYLVKSPPGLNINNNIIISSIELQETLYLIKINVELNNYTFKKIFFDKFEIDIPNLSLDIINKICHQVLNTTSTNTEIQNNNLEFLKNELSYLSNLTSKNVEKNNQKSNSSNNLIFSSNNNIKKKSYYKKYK